MRRKKTKIPFYYLIINTQSILLGILSVCGKETEKNMMCLIKISPAGDSLLDGLSGKDYEEERDKREKETS